MTAAVAELAGEWPMSNQQVVDLEERSWLPRHCRGDSTAFPALMAAYRRPVYSYIVRFGVPESERDDLFQNAFLKIHAAAASYEPGRALAPWIFTIVANTVRNHFRKAKNTASLVADEDLPDPVDPNPGPERVTAARQTVAWIERAVAELPLSQREVLVLATVAGLSLAEVAETLEMPLNTVKTNLRRARLALAEAMAERDGAETRPGGCDEQM